MFNKNDIDLMSKKNKIILGIKRYWNWYQSRNKLKLLIK